MSDDVDILGDPGAVVEALHQPSDHSRRRADRGNGARVSLDMAEMLSEILDEHDQL